MNLRFLILQIPNDPVALAEWFLFSVAIVVIVTVVYVFVLNRTPEPPGETVAKLEQAQVESQRARDPDPSLQAASLALQQGDLRGAVENSVKAVSTQLTELLSASRGVESSSMSISDMAYLIQTGAKSSPEIAQPVYQLNTLRLRAIQNQPIQQQEAAWAVSLANWLSQQVKTDQVRL